MVGCTCRLGNKQSRARLLPLLVLVAAVSSGCAAARVRSTAADPSNIDISQLWREPTDLPSRDLFHGPSPVSPPDSGAPFTFVESDTGGYSRGYEVRDVKGLTWSVKLGPEAQTEVVASRILWAIGYHQVPTYYVATWTMTGGPEATPGPARFRPDLPNYDVVGEWSWYENDFVATRPFKGLIVANVILNNWDWKRSNNRIYQVTDGGSAPLRRYVVRDLGASLGKTTFWRWLKWTPARGMAQGTRNDLKGFESQGFIKSVTGNRVAFDYKGRHHALLRTVQPDDVVWACELLGRLSDTQWRDAFRAAAYTQGDASRYVAKLKSKIEEGLALRGGSRR